MCAPLWWVAAYQLALLRRHAQVARVALAIGAIAAVIAGAASLGAELATNVVPTAPPDERWIVASVWSGLAAMLAWLIAMCVAGARLAARLAAGTLHLPNVRLRVRALQVRAVFVLIPWTTAMAIFAGALTGVRGLLVAVAGELLALLIVQLVLAQLAARGRALAAAELRSSR